MERPNAVNPIDLFHRFEASLDGWPDHVLTIAIVAVAIAGIAAAFFGPRWLKIMILAYWLFP